MIDHLRGPGFFTMVAGTGVLGSQFVLLAARLSRRRPRCGSLARRALDRPDLRDLRRASPSRSTSRRSIRASAARWLLAVVATQSLAVLGALLAAHVEQPYRLAMNFLALSMWLWGGMLYIWMMSLIFYRYTFFALRARRPVAALLDQHGRDGDLDAGRLAADRQCARRAVPAFAAAVPQGLHRALLGDRHLVDPDAAGARLWRYVYRRFPLQLRPAVLGRGVPARHVLGEHPRDDRGAGPAFPRVRAAALPLARAGRVDRRHSSDLASTCCARFGAYRATVSSRRRRRGVAAL